MIEVPSAAILVDRFAREAAFLSIGTNDLVQYSLAVDRGNRTLAYLASPFDPAIVRLIASVVRAGAANLRAVSVCGAMASDPLAAVLLIGLGVRELSMEAAALPALRAALSRVTLSEAEAVAELALDADTAQDVENAIAERIAPRLVDILIGEVAVLTPEVEGAEAGEAGRAEGSDEV
jgi:phosphotransferase system enzyme I (PtsI)